MTGLVHHVTTRSGVIHFGGYLLDYGLLVAILTDEERLVLRTELGQQRSALMSERETAIQRVEAAKHAGRALSQRLLWFFRSRARRWCRSIPCRT